jgi:hypothetical protein
VGAKVTLEAILVSAGTVILSTEGILILFIINIKNQFLYISNPKIPKNSQKYQKYPKNKKKGGGR